MIIKASGLVRTVVTVLVSLTLPGIASASSFTASVYDSVKVRIDGSCSGGAYCHLRRKVNGVWVHQDSYGTGTIYAQIYDFGPGTHELKLETYSYPGMSVIDQDLYNITIEIGGTVTYQYDEVGRLKKVTSISGKQTSYEYDDADNRKKKTIN